MTTPIDVTAKDAWIRPMQRRPAARLRLFCIPYAGGGPKAFRSWPEALPADVEVCAVSLPGREHRRTERPYHRMRPLVETLARAVLPWLDRPFALYGHSMGAMIGFALARELRSAFGAEPERLLVSGRRAPDVERSSRLHELPDDRFIEELCLRYNAIPQIVLDEPDLVALFLPVLRADFAVVETFEFTRAEPLSCPITAFGGTRDSMVSEADVLRWRSHTRGGFRHHMVEGDHFFIQGNEARFLTLLSAELDHIDHIT